VGQVGCLIDKAKQCFRLASQCAGDRSAEELRQLGNEHAARAMKLGADPRKVPRAESV